MKLKVMAVYDSASETFARPWFAQSTGFAVRAFSDEVNRADRDNPLCNHFGDFDLFELGEWVDDTGQFTCLDRPKLVVTGQMVKRENGNASE